MSPGKRLQLVDKATRKSVRFANYALRSAMTGGKTPCCIEPLPQDRRFDGADWQKPPYNFMAQAFLLQQQWWHNATTGIRGVTKHHEEMVEFVSRQMLDMVSPSNFLATNPEVLRQTVSKGGMNLVRGLRNMAEDWERAVSGKKPVGTENFVVGRDVAATPGKVVYRNRLIELIQYAPATGKVRPEPVLIVPAWIMKYYILDLSPHNSLVKYLTEQGFTVFMISWKNPDPDDRDLGLDDYRRLGVMAALDAVSAIVPEQKVHAVGYCLGGTLLSIAAAAMARDGDDRLKIAHAAGGADRLHRGRRIDAVHQRKPGRLPRRHDVGAGLPRRHADGGRFPDAALQRPHLVAHGARLSDGRARADDRSDGVERRRHPLALSHAFGISAAPVPQQRSGRGPLYWSASKPIALTDIRAPIFSVGTVRDHVAPWRSTYKINFLTDTEVTYLLTSGGHNAGIVSEPGHDHRGFQVMTRKTEDRYIDPEAFLKQAPQKEGSWWPEWTAWLAARSGEAVDAPAMGGAGACGAGRGAGQLRSAAVSKTAAAAGRRRSF